MAKKVNLFWLKIHQNQDRRLEPALESNLCHNRQSNSDGLESELSMIRFGDPNRLSLVKDDNDVTLGTKREF